jgi:hypothetical protein
MPSEQRQASLLTPAVMSLVCNVQVRLKRGELAGRGRVDSGPDGVWDDVEHVIRFVLAGGSRLCASGAFRQANVGGALGGAGQ